MTKITPYTALCELFRNKVDPNNDLENQITGTEQHGNVILLQNNQKNVPTINNSCQTQPLRDYSVDKVMQKMQTKQITPIENHAVNIALTDDNFQILRPDYAAYSGEKPYVETPPVKQEFNLRKITDKIQEGPKESFTPLFNRNWRKRKSPPQTPVKPQKVNNQTSITRPNGAFQERIIQPSYDNQYTHKNEDLEVFPELNLYRRVPGTKQNIHEYTQGLSEVRPSRKPNPAHIHSSYKNHKVNALYRTVSDLKTTFENKYHHCPNDNAEKCLCDHCGALAVVNESLKHPVIYDHHQEDDDESIYCKKHRKNIKRNNKHDEKEFIRLQMKLKMMEERIHELEEINYVHGPIKVRNSDLTFDMYTQCGKKKKKTRFADPPEYFRSSSPHKRFNPKVCPFSFTLPLNLKDKLFRRKSSQERKSEDEDSDDSDYKVKHVSRVPQRENTPKPRLRCHDYINKKKDVGTPTKKPPFWRSGKVYNVSVQNDDIPTKDIDVKTIKDKQIQELLIELSQRKIKLPAPEPKSVRFALDLKSNDTEVLYERKENGSILSSKSLLNSTEPIKSNNSAVLKPEIQSNETSKINSEKDYNYFFLKSPEMIEQLVSMHPYPSSNKSNNSAVLEPEIPSNETPKNNSEKDYNYFFLKSPEMIEQLVSMHPYPSSTEIPSKIYSSSKQEENNPYICIPNKIESSNTPDVSSRKSLSRKQDEIFRILHSMRQRDDFYNYSSKVNITPISKPSSAAKPSSNETKSIAESSTLSQTSDTTASKSICRYVNSNFSNKTSTTIDLNSSYGTVRNYKRSRSFSPVNKNSFDTETKQSLKTDTKRKKLTITQPNYKDKRPKSERNNRTYQDTFISHNTSHEHFVKLNKNVDRYTKTPVRPKYDFISRPTTPERRQHENIRTQIVNYNINDCITKEIGFFEEVIKQETEVNDMIKNNVLPSPRKKWNFSFLNLTSEDVKIDYDQSKVNKQQIIKELSRLSASKSNFSTQISVETSTDSNKINNVDSTSINTPPSKETMKGKSSIFSVLKRYSKQLLPKRKSKLKPSVKFTVPIEPPPKITEKRVEKTKTVEPIKTKIVNNKNISKIPVYRYPDANKRKNSSSHPQEAKTSGIFKFFSGKMCDKFCLFKPEMIDKETKLSNENINLNIVPSYTTTNTNKYGAINNQSADENEKRDESSVNTLVLNSIDSIFQSTNSARTMSNIIIFNPTSYNRNLPIICEQTPDNIQRNNLSIQTIVLQNLMPSIRGNDRQIILYPAKDTDTNPQCSTCNNTPLNLNPPESTVSKSVSNTSKSSKTEKKKGMIDSKCSNTVRCKTSEKKIKEVNYLPLEEKAVIKKVQIKDSSTKEYIQDDKCSCKTDKSSNSKCSTGKCNKNKEKCSKKPCQKDTKKDVKIKESIKFETPKTDLNSSCSCKTSPINLPKSSGVRSNLRKNKPGKCVKCSKTNAPVQKPLSTPTKVEKVVLNKTGCSCSSITQEDLLGPGEIAKTNMKPKKRDGSKCGSKCGSHKVVIPTKEPEIIKSILNQKKCKCPPNKQDDKNKTTVGTPAKVTEIQLDKKRCSCVSIKPEDLLGPGEIAKNKNKPKKNEGSKCSFKCSSHTIKTPKLHSVEKIVQGDTSKGSCKCASSTQDILLGPGEISKAKNKPTKLTGTKCNLKCSSHTTKTTKVQSKETLVQGDTSKESCKCASSTQDILLGPGQTPKKKKPAKTGGSKCSLKCSSHTAKTVKVHSIEKLVQGDISKGSCKCAPSTQSILLGPGEIPKKKNKPTKTVDNKCNLKCSSHTIKTPKVQSVDKLVHSDTNKESCKCATSPQGILGPEETPEKNVKPTKPTDNKCNLKCSSHTIKSTKKQSEEKLLQGDTNKEPCKCAPLTQDMLLGPEEISKQKKKPIKSTGNKCNLKCSSHTSKVQSIEKLVQGDTNKGLRKCPSSTQDILLGPGESPKTVKPTKTTGNKCNLKCSSHTIKTPKVQSVEKLIQDNTNKESCKCTPSTQDILLGPGKVPKQKTTSLKSSTSKCNLKCSKKVPPVSKELSTQSSTSICSCKSQKASGYNIEKEAACKKAKCFTQCVEDKDPKPQDKLLAPGKTEVYKKYHVDDLSNCDCKIPVNKKLITEQNEACKKIKCKRCAPQPPVTPKIERIKSNCSCDLSNLSISFETEDRRPKQTPSQPKNIELPPQCQCPGPNSGKCIKCTTSKPIIDSSVPKKPVSQNKTVSEKKIVSEKKSSKCVCKPVNLFPERVGKKKPSKTGLGKCNPDRCHQGLGDKLSLEVIKEPVPLAPIKKTKDGTKKKDTIKKVHIQKKVKKIPSKSSKTSLKPTHSNLKPSKTDLQKSPSIHSTKEDTKKKKSKTDLKKSPSKQSTQQEDPKKKKSKTNLKKNPSVHSTQEDTKKNKNKTCLKKSPSNQSTQQEDPKKKKSKTNLKKNPSIHSTQEDTKKNKNKTGLTKSPSKQSIQQEDPKRKKSQTKVKSKSPSLSKKSSGISSCSVCTECKRKISEQSLQHKSTETIPLKKKICNLRQMKNKITSKFSCKYFKSLYKHPIFARASRSKCKEMRMCIKNFCDVSKKDFDRADADSPEAKENNLLYGNTGLNSSVVNIYYNMQRFCFEPASDEVSYTEEDWHLSEDDKRDYLLEKLYLIRNFRDRIQDEGSTSNYEACE